MLIYVEEVLTALYLPQSCAKHSTFYNYNGVLVYVSVEFAVYDYDLNRVKRDVAVLNGF